MFKEAHADAAYGSRLLGGLKAAGLVNVGAEVHAPVVAGGSENWVRGSAEQLAARLAGRRAA